MAYITFFYDSNRRLKGRRGYHLESDMNIDFELISPISIYDFQLIKNEKIIASIGVNHISTKYLLIKKGRIGRFEDGWILNNNPNCVLQVRTPTVRLNNKIVAEMSAGGFIINALISSIMKSKVIWPDPFEKIEFDEEVMSPQVALCILLANISGGS